MHAERRKPGVPLELLHLEYLEQHPDGYRYTQFCEVYRRWLTSRGLSMRQVHHAGDKCFEAQIALPALLRALGEPALDVGEPAWLDSLVFRGVKSLPVTFPAALTTR